MIRRPKTPPGKMAERSFGASGDAVWLPRLLQLASAALPVGAFSYSSGLESARELGWLSDARGVANWLSGLGEHSLAGFELPLLARLQPALAAGDAARVDSLCEWLRAGRESLELRAQDETVGRAALRLLADLGVCQAARYRSHPQPSLLLAFALAGVDWQIPARHSLSGYAFAWCEGQLQAALKLGVLGHTDAQRCLMDLGRAIPTWTDRALELDEDAIGASTPGLAICSARHEAQYSRLFRS